MYGLCTSDVDFMVMSINKSADSLNETISIEDQKYSINAVTFI